MRFLLLFPMALSLVGSVWLVNCPHARAQSPAATDIMIHRERSDPPAIESSWDDLLDGVSSQEEWSQRRQQLQARFLELIRDAHKPPKPELDLQIEEEIEVEGIYRRLSITYQVESDERAHAFLGIPLDGSKPFPAVVALHGTTAQGTWQTAGLEGNADKAFLDQLCRQGYVVISPEHFVSGRRIPSEGSYDTSRFYQKHPEWTAVGKFTYEHSIAIDVLESLKEVDAQRIGVMGHSLGGHGSFLLSAYDPRVQATVCNCGGAFFRHNSAVEAWARDHWYVYFKPMREGLLKGQLPPIDFHEIISLIAPRAFLDISGLNDGNLLTQRQRVLMLLKVADVYEMLGSPENMAFFAHGRGHSVPLESRQLILGFLDAHLKPESATKTRLLD